MKKKFLCDCGRSFDDPDGPILCAQTNHGKVFPKEIQFTPGIKGVFEIVYLYLKSGEEKDIFKARQLIDCTVSMMMQLERIKVKIQLNAGKPQYEAMGIIENLLSEEITASRARGMPENMFDRPFIEAENGENCPWGGDLDTKEIEPAA